MKILVVSLLRIGDVIISAPVLRALRDRHPQAEIHLLLNASCLPVSRLLTGIDRTIVFERERIQWGLGEIEAPVFESYERLSDLVDELNSNEYDWVINLTHNRISGWLMNLIDSRKKSGLCLDALGRPNFGNSWFRFLNDQVDYESRDVFHFADIFRLALGLDETAVLTRTALTETAEGQAESAAFFSARDGKKAETSGTTFVAVQALTSDVKKDWGVENFISAIGKIARINPEICFLILGAPFERERLAPLISALEGAGINARLAIQSLEGTMSTIKKCRLLLTGDTSIKHLACAVKTPVVELSLGPSDLQRTGAFLHGSVIIQAKEACAPCVASRSCHRDHHACAARIPSDVVAAVVVEVYSGRKFQLAQIAEGFEAFVEIYFVQTKNVSYRSCYSVLEKFTEESVGRWLDLTSRKMRLDSSAETQAGSGQARQYKLSQRGTEALQLRGLMNTIHPGVSEMQWSHLLSDFERQIMSIEGRVNGFKVGLQYLRGCYEDPRRMKEYVRGLISFRERIRHVPLLGSFKSALDQVIEDDISPAFTRFRRINDLIDEIEARTDISLRLIRGLLTARENETGLEKT